MSSKAGHLHDGAALEPPILTGQPPVMQNVGTEAIETLGELMLFDKNISPNRNVACAFLPHAVCRLERTDSVGQPDDDCVSWISSLSGGQADSAATSVCTVLPAYFSTTRYRVYFLVETSGIHAPPDICYGFPTPNRHRVLPSILRRWASLTLPASHFGFRRCVQASI